MRKILNVVLLCALTGMLAACAVVSSPDRWKTVPADQSATIFGTVTTGDAIFKGVSLKFRNIQTGEEASFKTNIDATGDPELTKDKWQPGFVYEFKVPAGDYEFFNFFGAGGNETWTARRDFSIPFRVEAGRTYYIGEYRVESYLGKGIFVSVAQAGPYFLVIDNEKRDTELWLKRRKEAFEGEVIKLIPKIDPANPILRTTKPAFGDLGPYGGCSGWFC
ncbi:MAG TPA: hypothetical protein VFS04_06945 [Alphaproteobacteria bacterium]|nr:hypothetical protein [Alphaproteobacteria bacterium]